MPFKLIAPGKRKNSTWAIRGTIAGQRIKEATGTKDKVAAERFANDFEGRILEEKIAEAGDMSFTYAADAYIDFHKPMGAIMMNEVLSNEKINEINCR